MTASLSFGELILSQLVQTSALEWLGTITGFLCVYLAAKENILNWPISIISVLSYAVLFFEYHLFGDAALQIYFLGTAIYGWYFWRKNRQDDQKPVVSLRPREYVIVVATIIVLSGILGLFLDHFTPTDVPYIDGTCTAISFVAQVLLTRKVLQSWILWIIVDIMYVPLYLYKQLALTAILYILFLVIAAIGYRDWKTTWKTTQA
ncbi:MAG: nicotinamide riboside transporter PnuC [Arcticibacter sp.]